MTSESSVAMETSTFARNFATEVTENTEAVFFYLQKLGPETYTYPAKRYTYTMMRRVRVRVRAVADQSDHCRNRNRNRNRNRDRFPFWLAPFPHPPRKPRCEALSAPQQLGCTTRCLISESHHASFRYRPRSCFAIDLFGRALVRNALPQRSPRTQRLPI